MNTNKRKEFDAGLADSMRRDVGRRTAAFRAGWVAAERAAQRIMENNVDLRLVGGWTKVIRGAFEATVGEATVPGIFGVPMTIKSLLTQYDVADIRNAAVKKAR